MSWKFQYTRHKCDLNKSDLLPVPGSCPVRMAWWVAVCDWEREGRRCVYDVEDRPHKYYLRLIKTQQQNWLNWFVFLMCTHKHLKKKKKQQRPGHIYSDGKMQNMQYWSWCLEAHYSVCACVSCVCGWVCMREKARKKDLLTLNSIFIPENPCWESLRFCNVMFVRFC